MHRLWRCLPDAVAIDVEATVRLSRNQVGEILAVQEGIQSIVTALDWYQTSSRTEN
jgi:hypothetical protein